MLGRVDGLSLDCVDGMKLGSKDGFVVGPLEVGSGEGVKGSGVMWLGAVDDGCVEGCDVGSVEGCAEGNDDGWEVGACADGSIEGVSIRIFGLLNKGNGVPLKMLVSIKLGPRA